MVYPERVQRIQRYLCEAGKMKNWGCEKGTVQETVASLLGFAVWAQGLGTKTSKELKAKESFESRNHKKMDMEMRIRLLNLF